MNNLKMIFTMVCTPFLLNGLHAQHSSEKQLNAAFDKLIAEQFKPNETGGVALVARKGRVLYKKAFGMAQLELNVPMQSDMVFKIGSITKQFTAIAILQWVEQGKLSLQDDITKFFPDYPSHGHQITVQHLLTHTSGIKSYTNIDNFSEIMGKDMKPNEVINYFKHQPMEFAPGTKWNYNNSGYFLLGAIVEKISGKSYAQYVEEAFFKPLGMKQTGYGDPIQLVKNRVQGYEKGSQGLENAKPLSLTLPYAAGALQSTVEDLFIWNQAVNSYKLVTKETLEKAFTSYKLTDGKDTHYGYGWFLATLQGAQTAEHGGGIPGFSTHAIYLPKEDIFVAVFLNCGCISPNDLSAKMAAIALGKPYDYKEIPLDSASLQHYIGVYENKDGQQRIITLVDNQLYSQRTGSSQFKIKSFQKDNFFFEQALTVLTFERNAVGQVEKIISKAREGNDTWKKTSKIIPTTLEIVLDKKILDIYVGEYELAPKFIITITRESTQLFAQASGQGKNELFPQSETKFFFKVVDAQITFFKDTAGNVVKLVLHQAGREIEGKKIK
jgi:CubicO group peptidase (beta-lactamase class C family)